MRVLWTHNYNPEVKNFGTYMHIFADGLRKLGVDVELMYLGKLSNPRALLQARRRIAHAAEEFDLVHAQTGGVVGLATTAAVATAKVLSLRGSEWMRYRERINRETVHSALSVGMTRISIHAYDQIVVMSSRMRREVEASYPAARVTAIPDPIDLSCFEPKGRASARMALGEADDRNKWVLFTTLSRTNPIKRVELAEAAVAVAHRARGDVFLKVATGLRHDQMPNFVAACDVALSTSVHEGWPNAIKEALACNVPFVATDVSDLAEIAKEAPSCRVCPPDPAALGAALLDVMSEEPINLRRFVEPMQPEVSTRHLLATYSAAMAHWRKAAR